MLAQPTWTIRDGHSLHFPSVPTAARVLSPADRQVRNDALLHDARALAADHTRSTVALRTLRTQWLAQRHTYATHVQCEFRRLEAQARIRDFAAPGASPRKPTPRPRARPAPAAASSNALQADGTQDHASEPESEDPHTDHVLERLRMTLARLESNPVLADPPADRVASTGASVDGFGAHGDEDLADEPPIEASRFADEEPAEPAVAIDGIGHDAGPSTDSASESVAEQSESTSHGDPDHIGESEEEAAWHDLTDMSSRDLLHLARRGSTRP
ncbi:hypothetical protein H9P43_003492 [Blastocladiella emersonii ATCC 22665]|nr:hypothetical protein H9P43_003492 [Blastocladiella emersonii ATCC 22665]